MDGLAREREQNSVKYHDAMRCDAVRDAAASGDCYDEMVFGLGFLDRLYKKHGITIAIVG